MGKISVGPSASVVATKVTEILSQNEVEIVTNSRDERSRKYAVSLRKRLDELKTDLEQTKLKLSERAKPQLISSQYDDSGIIASLKRMDAVINEMDLDLVSLAAEIGKINYRLDKYEGLIAQLQNKPENSQVTQIVRQEYVLDKRVLYYAAGMALAAAIIGILF